MRSRQTEAEPSIAAWRRSSPLTPYVRTDSLLYEFVKRPTLQLSISTATWFQIICSKHPGDDFWQQKIIRFLVAQNRSKHPLRLVPAYSTATHKCNNEPHDYPHTDFTPPTNWPAVKNFTPRQSVTGLCGYTSSIPVPLQSTGASYSPDACTSATQAPNPPILNVEQPFQQLTPSALTSTLWNYIYIQAIIWSPLATLRTSW